MLRRLFTLVSALSLVLCVATCVTWVRSYRSEYRAGRVVRGSRYTLAISRGRATIFGPPPVPAFPSRSAEADAKLAAATLESEDIEWNGTLVGVGAQVTLETIEAGTVLPRTNCAAGRLDAAARTGAANRLLLTALERPEAFVAAHVLLTRLFDPVDSITFDSAEARPIPQWEWSTDQPSRTGVLRRVPVAGSYHGLRIEARLPEDPRAYIVPENPAPPHKYRDGLLLDSWRTQAPESRFPGREYGAPAADPFPCLTRIDAAQLPAIREQWHRRLDAPVYSVPIGAAGAGALVLPAVLCLGPGLQRLRAKSRKRQDNCAACGYDLRAALGRCPECGTASMATGAT